MDAETRGRRRLPTLAVKFPRQAHPRMRDQMAEKASPKNEESSHRGMVIVFRIEHGLVGSHRLNPTEGPGIRGRFPL